MRKFLIRNMDKWIHQNKAEFTGDYVEGCLLDNFVLYCKRGYAFVYERYVNPNMSEYEATFVPHDDKDTVFKLYDEFFDFERRSNAYVYGVQ